MGGAMRKMGVYLGLLEDAEGEYAENDFGYDEPARREPAPAARPVSHQGANPVSGQVSSISERRRGHAVPVQAEAPTVVPRASAALSRITTLHPRTYNEARVIGENFRDGIPVIMNLSEMSDGDAKRLVDFAAGLVFSVHGTIERVTNKVFLLSPPNVDVAAEDKQRIAEGGFFNQS